jgi:hypothetical protein
MPLILRVDVRMVEEFRLRIRAAARSAGGGAPLRAMARGARRANARGPRLV